MWGATPVTESVAEVVTERTGVRWLPAYGASELPVHRRATRSTTRPPGASTRPACRPPEVELRVVDLDTGAVLGPGEIGEIQARSPSVMAGYLPDEANADAFADGWYRTGDVGWLEPEGWVHLTDRSKEMIKVNGFQVAPAEVEAVLHGHPAVVDCAVFGIADERAGEVPVAAVQLDPDRPVADGELEQLVADSLATYKHLRHVVVVDAIPRLPSGKVLRRTLRDEWAPQLIAAGRTTDGRPPLPRAARAPRLGRPGRRPPRPARRRPSSTTPSGPAKLDAAVAAVGLARAAHRHDDGAPVGVGRRGRHRRRGARPRPRRRPVPRARPWPPSSAGSPARRRPRRPRRSCSRPTCRRRLPPATATPAGGRVAVDAAGRDVGPGARAGGGRPHAGAGRPRPTAPAASTSPGRRSALDPAAAVVAVPDQAQPLTDDDLDALDRPRPRR